MTVKLAFGTAGIRAKLGDGDDELNVRTVRAVGLALCDYLKTLAPHVKHGLCIGYDGREQSQEFARELSSVALAHGFLVRAFEGTVATPLLAFSTQRHRAALGLMVTASHNPPSDNGLKVYWQGGAQILPPHDAEIAARIARATGDADVPNIDLALARATGQLVTLGDDEQRAYLDAILGLWPTAPTDEPAELPPIAYSALYGVGSALTSALSERTGVQLTAVATQALPRPDLGGLASPNPEHRAALAELLALAAEIKASLAFCHDPDADRLAVAARDPEDGSLRVLSGDEVGALLTDFLLSRERDPTQVAVVSTLVSGSLAERIARGYGAHFERTLTGFKWITARGRHLERELGLRYLFGYEEALGYCFGSLGDDKDGIAALHVLLQLARVLHADGQGLWGRLEQLARRHGLYGARQITISASGEQGQARVRRIMGDLRDRAPAEWLHEGATRDDYLEREERADLLIFRTSRGSRVCVRPSGTEPKLKFYLETREELAATEPLGSARARASQALDVLALRIQALTA